MSLNDVATRIGVCVDTLEEYWWRGIREFEGAKYVVARKESVAMSGVHSVAPKSAARKLVLL